MEEKKLDKPFLGTLSTSNLRLDGNSSFLDGSTRPGNVIGRDLGTIFAGHTIIGDGNAVKIDRLRAGGDIRITDVPLKTAEKNNPITAERAFDRIAAAVKLNLTQIQSNIEQARKESSQYFRFTLVFAALGFLIVMAGVIMLYIGQTTGGVVAAVSSIVPQITAALFFKKDQDLRKTIEQYHSHMLESQKLLTTVDVAETIKSDVDQDKVKQTIIFSILGITR